MNFWNIFCKQTNFDKKVFNSTELFMDCKLWFCKEEITNYYRENFKTAGNLKLMQISSGGGVINTEISQLGWAMSS